MPDVNYQAGRRMSSVPRPVVMAGLALAICSETFVVGSIRGRLGIQAQMIASSLSMTIEPWGMV
jgi:hypothetical protein